MSLFSSRVKMMAAEMELYSNSAVGNMGEVLRRCEEYGLADAGVDVFLVTQGIPIEICSS